MICHGFHRFHGLISVKFVESVAISVSPALVLRGAYQDEGVHTQAER
jgi:hypothetical protein